MCVQSCLSRCLSVCSHPPSAWRAVTWTFKRHSFKPCRSFLIMEFSPLKREKICLKRRSKAREHFLICLYTSTSSCRHWPTPPLRFMRAPSSSGIGHTPLCFFFRDFILASTDLTKNSIPFYVRFVSLKGDALWKDVTPTQSSMIGTSPAASFRSLFAE